MRSAVWLVIGGLVGAGGCQLANRGAVEAKAEAANASARGSFEYRLLTRSNGPDGRGFYALPDTRNMGNGAADLTAALNTLGAEGWEVCGNVSSAIILKRSAAPED